MFRQDILLCLWFMSMESELLSNLASLFAILDPTQLSRITNEESMQWFDLGDILGCFKCHHPNFVRSTSIWIISLYVHKDTASHNKKYCSTIRSTSISISVDNVSKFLTYNIKNHKCYCDGEGKIKSCQVYEIKPDISHTTKVTATTPTTQTGEHSGHIT